MGSAVSNALEGPERERARKTATAMMVVGAAVAAIGGAGLAGRKGAPVA